MEEINDRLLRTQVFKSVSLRQADKPNPDGTLDINATLVEQPPRRIGFGGEIASLDGASVSAYWLHRNLLGGAERLRLDGEVSGIGAQEGGTDVILGATLTRPATFTPDTDLTFGVKLARLNEEDFNSYSVGANVGVEHRFSRSLKGRAGIGFEYLEVTDSTGKQKFQTLSLPLGLTWDKRDAPLNATKGFYLNGDLTPFGEITGETLGTRAFLDARIYQGVADGRLVLAARGQAGSILGTSLRDTPRDMLFYSGGAGTVRGHPFQSLGVFVLGPDQRSGGRSFVAASLEARLNVTDTIGVVGFYDAGFVGADAFLSDQGDWQSGAGIGMRYNTGIGPIRFDLALPVSGDTGEGLQFYIGIGQAF
jgi:translocation and assembly module TamA